MHVKQLLLICTCIIGIVIISGCSDETKTSAPTVAIPDTGLTYPDNSHFMGHYSEISTDKLGKIRQDEAEMYDVMNSKGVASSGKDMHDWLIATRQDFEDFFSFSNMTAIYAHNCKQNFQEGSDNWNTYDMLETGVIDATNEELQGYNELVGNYNRQFGDKYSMMEPIRLNISGYLGRASAAGKLCKVHYATYDNLTSAADRGRWFNQTRQDYDDWFSYTDILITDLYYYQNGYAATIDDPAYKDLNITQLRNGLISERNTYNAMVKDFNDKNSEQYAKVEYL